MRGLVSGLATPHPLGPALPAVYQEDLFAQRMLTALDEVVAPIYATLDNFDAYLDPNLAPDDFLPWLAGWVGMALDESWDVGRRREVVARAVELYRLRGTASGLAAQVEIQTGGRVEISENGATGWSVDPGGDMPGSRDPLVVIRVTVPDPRAIDAARLDAMVAAAKPAHVMHRIELVKGGPKDGPRATAASRAADGSAGTTTASGASAAHAPAEGPASDQGDGATA